MMFTSIMRTTVVTVISAGVVGNMFSFFIFLRPTFRKNSISSYGQALAIADLYTITTLVSDVYWLLTDKDFRSQWELVCKVHYYASIALSPAPGWILAVFSIDKLLNMKRSRLLTTIKKKSFQWTLVAVIYLFSLVSNLQIPILLELKPSNVTWINSCFLPNIRYYNIFATIYAFTSSVVPFTIMIVTSVLIIRTLRSSRQRLESIKKTTNVNELRRYREIKFAVSSLSFNISYIILRLPLVLTFLLAGYKINVGTYFNEIAYLLFYGNSSATLLIHVMSNSIFRHEMKVIFKCINSNSIESNAYQRQRANAIFKI